jgi:hypothetical protein
LFEGRWQPGPWTRVSADLGAWTNAPGSPFLERWHVGAAGGFALPGAVADVGLDLIRWVDDDNRNSGRFDPVAAAGLSGTPWPHGALAAHFYGDLRVSLRDGDVTALAGLRLYGSSDRGLDDVRPSDLSWRGIHDWAQDRAAARSWLEEGE